MTDAIGLYIHIPFCRKKCPYCDFFSGKATETDYDAYLAVLKSRITSWANKTNRPVATIYFGGGTPSILGTKRLVGLLSHIRQCFRLYDHAEVTLEVNPESGKWLDFKELSAFGFNRVSVGMQSAVPKELESLGRIHTAEEAKQTITLAQKAGIENISLDLMIGIPYQTKESLKASIAFCASCDVKHISAYLLKIEEGTPFFYQRGLLPIADEDEQADLYLYAVQELEASGYLQYEISNFAQKGFESRHNTAYWKCREYIGIGPSAHSFFEGKRFFYSRNLTEFQNNILIQDGSGGDEEEYIMLSLRLNRGLVLSEFEQRFHHPIADSFMKQAEQFAKAGYMVADKNHVAFTPKGYLISNTILSRLL